MVDMAFPEDNMVHDHANNHDQNIQSPKVEHRVSQDTDHSPIQEQGPEHTSHPNSDEHSDSGLPSDANVSTVSKEHDHDSHHSTTRASHAHQFEDEKLSEDEGLCQVDGPHDTPFRPSIVSTPDPRSINRVHQRVRSNSGQPRIEGANRAMAPTPATQQPRSGCYSDGYSSQYYRTLPRYAYGYSDGMQPIWYDQSAMTAIDPGYFHRNTPQPQMSSYPFFQSGYVSQSPVSPGQYYGWPPWASTYYTTPDPLYQPRAFPIYTPTHTQLHCSTTPVSYSHLPPPPPPPVFNPGYAPPVLNQAAPMIVGRDGPAPAAKPEGGGGGGATLKAPDNKKREPSRNLAFEKLEREEEQKRQDLHKRTRGKQFHDTVMRRIEEFEDQARMMAEAAEKSRTEKIALEAKMEAEKAEKEENDAKEAKKRAERAERKAKIRAMREKTRIEREEHEARIRDLKEKVKAEEAKQEAKRKTEREARERAVREAREKAEKEAKEKTEQDDKEKAEREFRLRALKEKAEQDAKIVEQERQARKQARLNKTNTSEKRPEWLDTFMNNVAQYARIGEWPGLHDSPIQHKPSSQDVRNEDSLKNSVAQTSEWPGLHDSPIKRKPSSQEVRNEDSLKTSVPQISEWPGLHDSPIKRKPSSREVRHENNLKTSVPQISERPGLHDSPIKHNPFSREVRYENNLMSSVPPDGSQLAHDLKKFVESANTTTQKMNGNKLASLREGSEPDDGLSRQTNSVIGMGRGVRPNPRPQSIFPEPKKTLEQRVQETNAWFHSDNREEPLFRRTANTLAERHEASPVDNNKDGEGESPEEIGARSLREKQTISLIGNVFANLGAYVSERNENRTDYFSNFATVHPRYCSDKTPDGRVSYFERDPLQYTAAGTDNIGPGDGRDVLAGASTVGRDTAGSDNIGPGDGRDVLTGASAVGRDTAGSGIDAGNGSTGSGTGNGSIGSSRGNQRRRSRANGEKKLFLIRSRRPEL